MKIFFQTLTCCFLCIQLCAHGNNFVVAESDYTKVSTFTSNMNCPQDSLALVALYNATGGPNWTLNTPWDFTQPISTWEGVFVNATGCVSSLYLVNKNLTGSLPPELGDMTSLSVLWLLNNQLSGSIPPEIGNMMSLTNLQLAGNQLSGLIPGELGNLSNLDILTLDNNQLSGCYDENLAILGSQLNLLANNNANISAGNMLDATWDDFRTMGAGACPGCNVTDSLVLVELYNATAGASWTNTWNLSQPMSTWTGVSTNADGCVTVLDLLANNMVGSLPPSIGELEDLTDLLLSYNDLSGNIPPEIGDLSNLTTLRLDDNLFTGSIPAAFANLSNLTELLVDYNDLSGCYDVALSGLCSQLNTSNNASISEGNNFDADWEDFCVTGDCAPEEPCPISLSLSGIIDNGLYHAGYNVYSNGLVPTGNDVQYKAGTIITMAAGFTVEPNAEFSAEIEDCGAVAQ